MPAQDVLTTGEKFEGEEERNNCNLCQQCQDGKATGRWR